MKGNLDTFSVVEMLQALGNAKQSGTLHIECPDRQVDVRFVAGRIAETLDSTRIVTDTVLGSQLIKRALVGGVQLGEALDEQERNPYPLGTLLVDRKSVAERDVREVLSRQIADTLVGAKAVGKGTFEFVGDARPKPVEYITIDVYKVLVEIASVADDYLLAFEALGQDDSILTLNRDYDGLPRQSMLMGRDEIHLLSLVDDRSTMRELAAASRLTEVNAVSILGKFVQAGILLTKAGERTRDASGDSELGAHRDSVLAEVSHLSDNLGNPESHTPPGSPGSSADGAGEAPLQ